MKQQNKNIEQLFKDKLQNFEASPGANAWANVQAGMAKSAITSSTVGGSSIISTSSAAVAVILISALIGGYFFFDNKGEQKIDNVEKPSAKELTEQQPKVESILKNQSVVESENPIETEVKLVQLNTKKETINTINQQKENKIQKIAKQIKEKEVEENLSEKTIDEIIAEHNSFIAAQKPQKEIIDSEYDNKKEVSRSVEKTEIKEPKITSSTTESKPLNEEKKLSDLVSFPNVFSPNQDGKNDIFLSLIHI